MAEAAADVTATTPPAAASGDTDLEQVVYFDFNAASIREDSKAVLAQVADALRHDGKVKIEINQTYPLARMADAHRDLEARKTTGSTVILP